TCDAVTGVVAAVPPDRVEHAAVRRDVREDLVTGGLVVDHGRWRVCSGGAVVADEEGRRLAADSAPVRAVGRSRRYFRSRLRRVVDEVDPLVRGVELV